MLDPTTGTVRFDKPPVEIPAFLTRSVFLASPAFTGATISVENDPWCSWRLTGELWSGCPFAVFLFFHGEKLRRLQLQNADPAFGTAWDDWSEPKERQRQAAHERWLAECIGSQRAFPWGSVWSGYDEKGGFSSIVIEYAAGKAGATC